MYDIIIVGAGTAGLSAAIYAVRAGKRVLILEAKMYGGQIINTPLVENYPGIEKISGFEFAQNLYRQAVNLGAEFKNDRVLFIEKDKNGLYKIRGNNSEYLCKSIILATGTVKRPLEIPGEKEFLGKGVSYCATCDGNFFKGKEVVVAGGGNTALTDAVFLSQYCSTVYIVHRRDTFKGEYHILELLKEKTNVQFVLNTQIIRINGDEKVNSVQLKSTVTDKEFTLPTAGVFVAVGQKASNEAFEDIVELDSGGYIKAEEDCHSSVPGIYAAGDCRTKKVRQLATAAADGAVAALEAVMFVNHLKNTE